MALPNVKITIENGLIGGLLNLAEGVAGLVCTGVTQGAFTQGMPVVIYSLAQLRALGVTKAGNPTLYSNVEAFYSIAGEGAEMYVMAMANTDTQAGMLDPDNAAGAVKLLEYAKGRVRLLATAFSPAGAYDLDDENGLDADVFAALTEAQALHATYAAKHIPLRIIVEGRAYTGDPAELSDLHLRTNRAAGVFIGSDAPGEASLTGLLLGAYAAVPVQRSAARVKNGALPITTGYVGAETVEDTPGVATIHDKGYITLRTIPGLTGYFITDDPTAVSLTDDYHSIPRGRVIDKAHIIAYNVYVQELNDEVQVEEGGRLAPTYVAYMEGRIETQLNELMVAQGNISSVRVHIDPTQDVITTNKVEVVVRLTPVGYNKEIEVKLGFENPAN